MWFGSTSFCIEHRYYIDAPEWKKTVWRSFGDVSSKSHQLSFLRFWDRRFWRAVPKISFKVYFYSTCGDRYNAIMADGSLHMPPGALADGSLNIQCSRSLMVPGIYKIPLRLPFLQYTIFPIADGSLSMQYSSSLMVPWTYIVPRRWCFPKHTIFPTSDASLAVSFFLFECNAKKLKFPFWWLIEASKISVVLFLELKVKKFRNFCFRN